ncbi:MAG: hypothetical protein JWL77_2141, partial [Chthonomonadaceae bacterium]|nr:hypothetical protein [Chthonomonadaceae bacterium]
ADIILGGAILLSQALAHLGSLTVEVSTRGLRWGLLYDRFLEHQPVAEPSQATGEHDGI